MQLSLICSISFPLNVRNENLTERVIVACFVPQMNIDLVNWFAVMIPEKFCLGKRQYAMMCAGK